MIRTGAAAASWMNARAAASGSTPWTRSSVDRNTREINDVMMIDDDEDRRDLDAFRALEMLTTVV